MRYARLTREDIRRNRDNLAAVLRFVGLIVRGKRKKQWLADVLKQAGEKQTTLRHLIEESSMDSMSDELKETDVVTADDLLCGRYRAKVIPFPLPSAAKWCVANATLKEGCMRGSVSRYA